MANRKRYHTSNREHIFDAIQTFETPFTARELQIHLELDGIYISNSSLYRTLDELSELGALKKTLGPGGAVSYRFVERCRAINHCNLECVECHKIYHVDCKQITDLARHIGRRHGFQLSPRNITLPGLCSECRP